MSNWSGHALLHNARSLYHKQLGIDKHKIAMIILMW